MWINYGFVRANEGMSSLLSGGGNYEPIYRTMSDVVYSPVISCHIFPIQGTTEWQRFEGANMFIRVPKVTVPKFQKIPLKENVLQRF